MSASSYVKEGLKTKSMDTLSMEDVIFIELDSFFALKTNCNEADRKPSNKVVEILLLDCFNEAKCKQVASTIIKPKITKNFFRETKPPRARTMLINAREKCMREITSNINKINGSNLDVIATRIIKVMDDHNAEEIVNHVLEKACSNGSYLEHFIALIDRIQDAFKTPTLKCMQAFTSNFISNMTSQFNALEGFDYNDYDQFCQFLKLKNTLLNKNKLILIYMSREIVECNIEVYFQKINSHLDLNTPIHLQDTIVQMIVDIPIASIDYNMIATLYHESFLSTKSKFMIQDILTKIEASSKNVFVCKAKKNTIRQKK